MAIGTGRTRAAVVALVLAVGAGVGTLTWAGRDGDVLERRPGAAVGTPAPGELRESDPLPGRVEATIGVASFNALRHLDLDAARADWDKITAHPQVDLIGWQESKSPAFRALHPQYRARGWETWFHPDPDGPVQLAVSWRPEVFELLAVDAEKMHDGGYPRQTDAPFPARWVVTAQLRHRPTGRTVTLLNTHVNHHIETGQEFQDNLNARRAKQHLARLAELWPSTPGDVVVGTGDYNFDHADDAEARPRGGITRRFAGRASSSYDVLGLSGLRPTRGDRWIDYVFLADHTMRSAENPDGLAQFARHQVLAGYRSDHSPLLARVRLYAP